MVPPAPKRLGLLRRNTAFEPSLSTRRSPFPGNRILWQETTHQNRRAARATPSQTRPHTKEPANSRPFSPRQEISQNARLRGGARRIRTCLHTVMSTGFDGERDAFLAKGSGIRRVHNEAAILNMIGSDFDLLKVLGFADVPIGEKRFTKPLPELGNSTFDWTSAAFGACVGTTDMGLFGSVPLPRHRPSATVGLRWCGAPGKGARLFAGRLFEMAQPKCGNAPSWCDLPSDRRARLTVLIARLAARRLLMPMKETAHEPEHGRPDASGIAGKNRRPSS
jgi:hypothetical protein